VPKALAPAAGALITLALLASCSSGKTTSNAFSRLYDERNAASIKVTYESLGNDGSVDGTFTASHDGPGKAAFISPDRKVVVNGDTVTTCTNMNSAPKCASQTGSDAVNNATADFTSVLDIGGAAIQTAATSGGFAGDSTATIAGREASCATITTGSALGASSGGAAKKLGADVTAGYETCLDRATGVLLKWSVVGERNDKSAVVATKVEPPSPADFALPPATSTTTR
jgi:hypothetical protein